MGRTPGRAALVAAAFLVAFGACRGGRRSTVLATDAEVTTPAGRFSGCIRVKDVAPLSKTEELKFYCPRVGIVREEEPDATTDLVRHG